MLQNGGKRLAIWKELTNPFDYNTFVVKCSEQGLLVMPAIEFSQKVGLMMTAKSEYPDLEIEKAYVMYVSENSGYNPAVAKSGIVSMTAGPNTVLVTNASEGDVVSNALVQSAQKPCCGGGKVL